jgi:hypothetical protein
VRVSRQCCGLFLATDENMPISPIHRLARLVDHRLKQAGTRSPGIRRLVRLLDTIHYTSLKTEEGRPLQLRIALVDPSNPDPDRPLLVLPDRWTITKLQPRVPLNVPSLTKLSKAADPWSSTLAVYYDRNNEFFVWHASPIHDEVLLRPPEKYRVRRVAGRRDKVDDPRRKPTHHLGKSEGALLPGDDH